ncbi:MAG: B12-binding domain-containing radical SAM protein [Candidatus Bathyarchaeota archaeon]|nr:B12-binding domain-containing radical SAM protein [Candidatus Bathyarchaeota archaeon]
MPLHVTLVNPPYPAGSHQHPPFTPLGLGYLAAVLEKNGYKVDVIDCQVIKMSYEEIKSEIYKRQPNIVGITSTTLTYKSALRIAQVAKEICPNCVTVIGGSHVTFWDDKALQECPSLDVVVRKEGEITMLELAHRVAAGKSYSDILGITCRKNGEISKTPDRPYLENLDELPFPAHHLWPLDRLLKHGKVIFPVMTSRGCVCWCDFCTAVRMFGRRYRMRSPKNVVDEIEFLNKVYGARQFTFYDDAFTVDQKRAAEICREITSRKLKIEWDCETRVDMVTKELLRTMKESGCIAVWFGVESGSPKVLDAMQKGTSPAQILKAFKMAKEVGLMTVAGVILGFPGETKETAWETIKFVERVSPDDVGYYIATPYPGTPLYESVKEKGLLKITDFDKYDTATLVFENPNLSPQELRDIREQAFQRFYLRPAYFLSMIGKGRFWSFSIIRTIFAHLRRAVKLKMGLK